MSRLEILNVFLQWEIVYLSNEWYFDHKVPKKICILGTTRMNLLQCEMYRVWYNENCICPCLHAMFIEDFILCLGVIVSAITWQPVQGVPPGYFWTSSGIGSSMPAPLLRRSSSGNGWMDDLHATCESYVPHMLLKNTQKANGNAHIFYPGHANEKILAPR